MTTNVRIEMVCSPSYQNAPKIKIQAQEKAGGTEWIWKDSGEPIYLRSAFELTSALVLHDSRRYVIEEVK